MAFSKHFLYNQEDQVSSGYARALSFPGRLEILRRLQREGPLCVQVIAEGHPISKEALSDHLRILREAQLVRWEERYPYTFYWVHEANLQKAEAALMRFFQHFKREVQ